MTQVTKAFVHSYLPVRDRNGHKGTFGKVHILAGCVGFTGAPALASAAAVRTGSGLVFLSVPQEIWPVLAVKCQEAMPSPVPSFTLLLEKMNQSDAVLIGPRLRPQPKNRRAYPSPNPASPSPPGAGCRRHKRGGRAYRCFGHQTLPG